jgi:hypothetical protein
MSETPKTVFAQIKRPSGDDPGQISEGHYTIADGVLTMTTRTGKVVRDECGHTYTHKLQPADNADAIARQLTRKIRKELRARGPAQGFSGPINYPKHNLA